MIDEEKVLEIYDRLIEERYIQCLTYGSILYNRCTKENGHTYQLTLTKNAILFIFVGVVMMFQ